MDIFVVSYDLKAVHEPDYDGVLQAVAFCGDVNHFHKSVCLVASKMSAAEIRETIKPRLRAGDSVFVALLASEAGAWCGWNTRLAAWIAEERAKDASLS